MLLFRHTLLAFGALGALSSAAQANSFTTVRMVDSVLRSVGHTAESREAALSNLHWNRRLLARAESRVIGKDRLSSTDESVLKNLISEGRRSFAFHQADGALSSVFATFVEWSLDGAESAVVEGNAAKVRSYVMGGQAIVNAISATVKE